MSSSIMHAPSMARVSYHLFRSCPTKIRFITPYINQLEGVNSNMKLNTEVTEPKEENGRT